MSKTTALRPSFLTIPAMVRPEPRPATEESLLDDEKALHSLYEQKGWKILETFVGELLSQLDEVNLQAMNNGAKFEEIGQNTVVTNLAKSVINRILTKVSDAHEAVEKVANEQ